MTTTWWGYAGDGVRPTTVAPKSVEVERETPKQLVTPGSGSRLKKSSKWGKWWPTKLEALRWRLAYQYDRVGGLEGQLGREKEVLAEVLKREQAEHRRVVVAMGSLGAHEVTHYLRPMTMGPPVCKAASADKVITITEDVTCLKCLDWLEEHP